MIGTSYLGWTYPCKPWHHSKGLAATEVAEQSMGQKMGGCQAWHTFPRPPLHIHPLPKFIILNIVSGGSGVGGLFFVSVFQAADL